MKSRIILILSLFSLLFSPATYGRRPVDSGKSVVSTLLNDTADARRVEKALTTNAPAAPKDHGLPRFALVGKNHEFYLGVGAQFLGEAVFDIGDQIPSPLLFAPATLIAARPGSRESLGFAWQSSSIYLNFVAMPQTDNSIGLFFKGSFTGSGNNFSCYHFYARFRGLSVGYTSDAFTDAAAEPMTLDYEGPNGYPYATLFNASWTQKFGHGISAAIGIDAPSASISCGSTTGAVSPCIPAVPLYVQYAWGGDASHVRLSGLLRPFRYRNLVLDRNTTLTGLGAQLSGIVSIMPCVSFCGNIVYGSGIGSYIQDDAGLGLDAMPASEPGRMAMTRSLGLTAGLAWTISPRLCANLSCSRLANYPGKKATVPSDGYRHGEYLAANIIYTVNRFVSAGIEYDYGHRRNFGPQSLHTSRIQAQFALTL
ncbi:MAG: hypothetical protein K2M06_04130 [Muribaculaceae bacterium]|nr:hypothetical protein [Muribaculaceae bacterium]